MTKMIHAAALLMSLMHFFHEGDHAFEAEYEAALLLRHAIGRRHITRKA